MKIRVTSIASEEVAAIFRDISNHFQTAMCEELATLRYLNFDQLMLTFVCSEDQYSDNQQIAKRIRLTGKATDFLSGSAFRFINIGIPMDAKLYTGVTFSMVRPLVCDVITKVINECKLPPDASNGQLEYRKSVIKAVNSARFNVKT